MAISYRKKAILRTDSDVNQAVSHESRLVTVTATMGNGSLLVDDAEGAVLDAATVNGVIDDPKFDEGFYPVGEAHLVSVCFGNATANSEVIKFSDATYGAEALTALEANGLRLQAAETDFSRTY